MKRILATLKLAGIEPKFELVPDGKLKRFGDEEPFSQYFALYQNFSSATGEEYFTVVYGDFRSGRPENIFYTIQNASSTDKTAVNKRIRHARAQIEIESKKFIDEVSFQIADISGVPSEAPDLRPEGSYIHALGFKEKEYYFTSSHNRQIISISRFTEADLLNLQTVEYWEQAFPGPKSVRIDWLKAKSELMRECRKRGFFKMADIRGLGVWNDEGRVVVNLGSDLLVDGIECGLHSIKSKYYYTLAEQLPPLHPHPLSADECNAITDICELFKWKNPDFGILLAGSLVTLRVCGALPIRPHIWVTGEKGAGKSTLFNRLINPMLGESALFLAGSTTEAGIRQSVSANAVPVIFDEFENNGVKSAESIRSVLDLMRVAWSETNAVILKGGSSGVSQSYQARFSAIVTSIRQVSMTDADRSRFATIELGPHDADPAHWQKLDGLLNLITPEFGNRLFARTIRLLPMLLENFKIMKRALTRTSSGQRFGDQYGMLLAGYALLMQDEVLTIEEADRIASHMELADAKEEMKENDHETCLDYLLTKKVNIEINTGSSKERVDRTISEIILEGRANYLVRDSLTIYGIKIEGESFYVQSFHNELENSIFKGTRWSGAWSKSLIRLAGAERKTVRIGGIARKAISIPFTYLTKSN